jgi:hypothetical protein
MVCHAGRYTTVNKSDDVKLQYGLVNVQPVVAAAAAAAADVVVVEEEAVVVADGFASYKSATRSASLAGTLGETLLDADLAVDSGSGAYADLEADADAVLPLTGGWLCRNSTSLGTAWFSSSLASSSSSFCCFFRAAGTDAGRRSEKIHSSRGFPDEGDADEARGVMLLGTMDSVATAIAVAAVVEGF